MAALQEKADFRIKGNFIPELRKDMIDTMVQNGTFAGWKQQMKNVKNYFIQTDKDDGFQTLEGLSPEGKKVPIFFTDKVGNYKYSQGNGHDIQACRKSLGSYFFKSFTVFTSYTQ